jgi:hypothetical protein
MPALPGLWLRPSGSVATVSYYDRKLQCLRCPDCGEKTPLRRASTLNPERLVLLIECFALKHAACAEYANYALARAHRIWRNTFRADNQVIAG